RCKALNITFDLGRAAERGTILLPQSSQQVAIPRIPGRVVLDGIDTLRSATWSFESFSLEYVANELLGRGKLINESDDKVAEIMRMYREQPDELIKYNLEDCQLVLDIADKADLIGFAIERSRLTGLAMDRIGGSVAAFDYLYLPRLHRQGFVAPDIGDYEELIHSPGGYVMDSQPGLYQHVLVLDFKSLYPSIIRTFHIDPLGLAQPGENPINGFSGGTFSRTRSLLPDIISNLWSARDRAKQQNNTPLSTAIKIIMNSFYGVLGTPGCRFFSPKLAGSITRRGHEIIKRSKEFIESSGYQVIYGDTDSVFVLLGDLYSNEQASQIGHQLQQELNEWWQQTIRQEHQTESYLEIEFETHYSRFVMPTIRGSEKGSKKRYAGLIEDGNDSSIIFKGLESVRTDWTLLARNFQRELYRRVFHDLPYEDYIRDTAHDLLNGQYNDLLFYRKRLRRNVQDYVKNVPPHAQAAKKLLQQGKTTRGWIEYMITINGPEPKGYVVSTIDYEHYLERQIKPIADGILQFLDKDIEQILSRQMSIF
ncbi:MAG: DNA polymerase II, partial [Gammaproteobacteria bacterium]|nr:DNA polymerase II [Gammaproteobacteria bacterium]